MDTLIKQIREQTAVNFINLETAVRTYSRDALVCGSPAWRYVYHTIHSADKWFINPCDYTEPDFHTEGLDNPDKSSSTVLTDSQLLEYLSEVREKTFAYLDTLDDYQWAFNHKSLIPQMFKKLSWWEKAKAVIKSHLSI